MSREDSYAPKIIAELKQAQMIVVEGTLYPILTRQKNAGLLTYRWEESPQGPPRKYYMLTEAGRRQLALLDEAWDEMVEQIKVIRHGKAVPQPSREPARPDVAYEIDADPDHAME